MLKNFAPIFDLNRKSTILSRDVLLSALELLGKKADEFIDTGLRTQTFNNKEGTFKAYKEKIEAAGKSIYDVYDDMLVAYFQDAVGKIKDKIHRIEYFKETPLTIDVFNVISFQFILLFTDILLHIFLPLREQHKPENKSYLLLLKIRNDENLERFRSLTTSFYFEKLNNYGFTFPEYCNYNTIYEKIETRNISYNYLISNKTNDLIPTAEEGRDPRPTHIILFLGEIEIEELTKAFINDIYIIGLTMELETADGVYLTPYEFLLHDVKHGTDRMLQLAEYGLIYKHADRIKLCEMEKIFVNYIDGLELTDDEKYHIYLMLFFIIHESIQEIFLALKEIPETFRLYLNDGLGLSAWTVNGIFNGLLKFDKLHIYEGDERVELDITPLKYYKYKYDDVKNDDAKLEEYRNIDKLRVKFTDGITRLFLKKWNECFKDRKGVLEKIPFEEKFSFLKK